MVKAEFDSEADALSIVLSEVEHWDETVTVDDTYCHVAYSGGRPVNIELLSPAKSLYLLAAVAEETGAERDMVEAAAKAALSAPDRVVTIEFSAPA